MDETDNGNYEESPLSVTMVTRVFKQDEILLYDTPENRLTPMESSTKVSLQPNLDLIEIEPEADKKPWKETHESIDVSPTFRLLEENINSSKSPALPTNHQNSVTLMEA